MAAMSALPKIIFAFPAFVPKTITIAFEENYEESIAYNFLLLKTKLKKSKVSLS